MPRQTLFLSFFLLFIISAKAAHPSVQTGRCDLSVAFDIPASRLTGTARFNVGAGELSLDVGSLVITGVTLDDSAAEHIVRDGRITLTAERQGLLTIRYEAVFREDTEKKRQLQEENVIGSRGIVLSDAWYPRPDGLMQYRLRAVLPKGYEALSEADKIVTAARENTTAFEFHFDHPVDGITLVASDRYHILKDRLNGTELFAFFFPEDRNQARKFLQQAKASLEVYERLLGPYPYKRFTIGQHLLSATRSVPTLTLLGREAARGSAAGISLLSGEVLSQWFGNSVYVDRETGNWADGLIAYLSDHRQAEKDGNGWEFRKQLLSEYHAFVHPKNEISLGEYRDGRSRASRAVGRGKGALVFHMLKRTVGEDVFFDSLKAFTMERRYRKASWNEIRAAFEKETGTDLSAFFAQWVDRKGLAELGAGKQAVVRNGSRFEVSFELTQKGTPYDIEIPVQISLHDGVENELLKIETEKKNFDLSVDREPRTLVIDGKYDTARRLTDGETAPVLAGLFQEKTFLVSLPASNREAYDRVMALLKEWGGEESAAADLTNEAIKQSSIAVLGRDNPLIARLFGSVPATDADFSITVKKNPWNQDKVIALIDMRPAGEGGAALARLPAYAWFSRIAFTGGANVLQETEVSERGISMELRRPATAIDLSALRTLHSVIEASAEKRIVYIGEYHDRHAHHAVQLDMIRGMFEKNPKLAIGMEMFQQPFQKVVDDFIAGEIDERGFLKGTEYFKRWGFDYNLYKPILDFARDRKIPVVALNQKKEIVEKVSKSGLDALTVDERASVPKQMDFSDDAYRRRLKDVFDLHKGSGERNFDFFYQAQVLWDETMAESADAFLQKNRDYSLVVIAGGGHLAFGSGIPKRCFRRNGLPHAIVLNDGEVDKDIADYLILPGELDGAEAPKLMAVLKAEGDRVNVVKLPDDSVSRKAGVRPGDVILALDGEPVQSVEDIRLLLFYKKKGEILKVSLLRKRTFLSDKMMELEVRL